MNAKNILLAALLMGLLSSPPAAAALDSTQILPSAAYCSGGSTLVQEYLTGNGTANATQYQYLACDFGCSGATAQHGAFCAGPPFGGWLWVLGLGLGIMLLGRLLRKV